MDIPYTAPNLGPTELSRLFKPRHTVEDLLAIKLAPSNSIIRLVVANDWVPATVDFDAKMKSAFLKYPNLRKPLLPWYKTTMKPGLLGKLRFAALKWLA